MAGPLPAPVPAPDAAPIPEPVFATRVDQIVALLQGTGNRDQVSQALTEQNSVFIQFRSLLPKDEERTGGRDDITITDTQCKP